MEFPEWALEIAKRWADPDAFIYGGPDEDDVHELAKAVVEYFGETNEHA